MKVYRTNISTLNSTAVSLRILREETVWNSLAEGVWLLIQVGAGENASVHQTLNQTVLIGNTKQNSTKLKLTLYHEALQKRAGIFWGDMSLDTKKNLQFIFRGISDHSTHRCAHTCARIYPHNLLASMDRQGSGKSR